MSTNEGTAPAAPTATSTPNEGGSAAVDAIAAELDGLLKAGTEREDEAQEVKPETEAETEGGDETKPEDEPEPEVEAKPKPDDPKTARGLAQIAREKRRLDQHHAQQRQELAKERAEVQQMRTQAEAATKSAAALKARAKSDPVGALLEALGENLAPEQLDYVAQQFYRHAKAGTNPEYKAAAERDRREREASHTAQTAAEQIADLKKQIADKDAAREAAEQVREYLGTVEVAVGEETPLLQKALRKNPKATREELRQVAHYLADQLQTDWPAPGEVTKAWEKWQRSQLAERFDLDVDALVRPAAPKQTTPVAGEKKRPVTISNDIGTQTRPRSTPLTREALEAEVLRDLEAGRVRDD